MPKKLIFCFSASSTCINFFQDIIKELSISHEVFIISGKDHAFKQLNQFSKNNSLSLSHINFPRKITIDLISVYRSIKDSIKKIDANSNQSVIFSNTPIMSLLLAFFRLFNPRIKHIHFCHGLFSYNQSPLVKLFYKFFEQVTFLLSDEIIFVSNSLKNYAEDHYFFPQQKIHKINSIVGVDIPNIPVKQRRQFRIGFFGRVCFDKGFEDFHSLYKILPEDFFFIIAGPIDDKKYGEILKSSDKRFKYLGVVQDRAKFFSKVDLLFFPSIREGFGVSIIESSAYGIPTIAYDIVGVLDSLHHGKNGFRVKYRDMSSVISIIRSLKENKEYFNELQQESIAFVKKNFLKEAVLTRNLAKINELL